MRMKWIIGLIVLLVVAGGILWYNLRGTEIVALVEAVDDQDDPISNVDITLGQVTVRTSADGRVKISVMVHEGDSIVASARRGERTMTSVGVVTVDELEEGTIFLPPIEFPNIDQPRTGLVIFTSPQTPGVRVRIDEQPVVPLPEAQELSRGPHTFSFSKPSYLTLDTSLTLDQDTVQLLAVLRSDIHPKPPGGLIVVRSSPDGARVRINGDSVGVTPFQRRYRISHYLIETSHGGETKQEERDLTPEGLVLTFEFAPIKEEGSLDLRSSPSGAQIIVDNLPRNERTPAILNLSPGEHRITVVSPGKTQEIAVTIIPHRTIVRYVSAPSECVEAGEDSLLKGRFVEAVQILEGCTQLQLTSEQRKKAGSLLGQAYYNMKNFTKALATLQTHVASLGKNDALAYYFIALSLEQLGEAGDAIDAYKEVERYQVFLPSRDRTRLLGEVKFGTGYNTYLLYVDAKEKSPDEEKVSELKVAAEEILQEFVEEYCSDGHSRCGKAKQKLEELQQE